MSMGMDIITGTVKRDLNSNDVDMTICCVGQRGAGKSEAALEFCRKVDPSFEKTPRIVFTIDEYMDTVDSMQKGQALIFDEAGVNMGAREWMHLQNKVFNYTKQLDRFNNLLVIYTVPDLSFIDLQLRKMLDAVIVCRKSGIDRANHVNATKFLYVNTSALGGNIYYEPFIFHGPDGDVKIDPLYVPQAPPELVAKYKAKSIDFKRKRIEELKNEARGVDGDEAFDKKYVKQLRDRNDVLLKLLDAARYKMGWKDVTSICGMSNRQLSTWLKEAGYESAVEKRKKERQGAPVKVKASTGYYVESMTVD